MYIHEAIKKAQEENLCIKRECWDSARICLTTSYWEGKAYELRIDGSLWTPVTWELTADDWLTCSYPEEPCTLKEQEPEPVKKKHDTDMDVILRRMGTVALGLSILSFLVAVSALVIKLLPLFQ